MSSKMCYEEKKTIKIVGLLKKDESDGRYYVEVQGKDFTKTFELDDILDDMLETVISFSNEEYLK